MWHIIALLSKYSWRTLAFQFQTKPTDHPHRLCFTLNCTSVILIQFINPFDLSSYPILQHQEVNHVCHAKAEGSQDCTCLFPPSRQCHVSLAFKALDCPGVFQKEQGVRKNALECSLCLSEVPGSPRRWGLERRSPGDLSRSEPGDIKCDWEMLLWKCRSCFLAPLCPAPGWDTGCVCP